jgi:hypothetical protein
VSYTAAEAGSFILGQGGFDRLTGTSTHIADHDSEGTDGTPVGVVYYPRVKRWNRIKALTACTFDAGCEVQFGDALIEDDVLPISHELTGVFTTIVLKSGVLIAYRG